MRVTILGCGTSSGVPLIGCRCPVCVSSDPRNRRQRCSIYVETRTTQVLVDTPPDLRNQCLAHGIDRADAILYTHAHADHTNGIDDVRSLNSVMGHPIEAYADASVLARIRERFDYAFQSPLPEKGWIRPCLVPMPIEGSFIVGDLTVVPFRQQHGRNPSWGFRFGDFAYSTDCDHLSDEVFEVLDGISTWVVDCLCLRPHPSHAHLARTLSWIERLQPKHAILTHMNHELDYSELTAKLPPHVEPAYDGLVVEVESAGTDSSERL